MKTIITCTCLALAFPLLGASNNDWLTLDAGGGAQFSANYLVNFTAGQNDAGAAPQTSANYVITPGFWAVEDMGPEYGRPELFITVSGPNVTLWWISPSTGFELQQADAFPALPLDWSNTPGFINDNGIIKSITIPHNVARRFYRLRKP